MDMIQDTGEPGWYWSRSQRLQAMTSHASPVDWDFVVACLEGSEPRLRYVAIMVCHLRPLDMPANQVGAITRQLLSLVDQLSDEIASAAISAVTPFPSAESEARLRALLVSERGGIQRPVRLVLALWGDVAARQVTLREASELNHFGTLSEFWARRFALNLPLEERWFLKSEMERFLADRHRYLAEHEHTNDESTRAQMRSLEESLQEPL